MEPSVVGVMLVRNATKNWQAVLADKENSEAAGDDHRVTTHAVFTNGYFIHERNLSVQ